MAGLCLCGHYFVPLGHGPKTAVPCASLRRPLVVCSLRALLRSAGARPKNRRALRSTSPPAWVSLPLPTVRHLLTSRHGLAPLPSETISVFLNCRLRAGQPFLLPPPLVRHPFTSQDMASVSPAGDDHGLFELPASGRPTPSAATRSTSLPTTGLSCRRAPLRSPHRHLLNSESWHSLARWIKRVSEGMSFLTR
jgi:hypothetical protein